MTGGIVIAGAIFTAFVIAGFLALCHAPEIARFVERHRPEPPSDDVFGDVPAVPDDLKAFHVGGNTDA